MKMKKCDVLLKARHYLQLANIERAEHGDTIKHRDYLRQAIQFYDIYFNLLNGRCRIDYELYKALDDDYFNNLIFTPTIEDLEEMRTYWPI